MQPHSHSRRVIRIVSLVLATAAAASLLTGAACWERALRPTPAACRLQRDARAGEGVARWASRRLPAPLSRQLLLCKQQTTAYFAILTRSTENLGISFKSRHRANYNPDIQYWTNTNTDTDNNKSNCWVFQKRCNGCDMEVLSSRDDLYKYIGRLAQQRATNSSKVLQFSS